MTKYDAIIIGAGLGGLVAGAKLAKEGKKILLIEQHNIPGGCATNFKRVGSSMDVGLHALDGMDDGDLKKEIFDELKVFGNVEFAKLPEFYRFVNERFDIVIPDNYKEAEKILISNFPKEKSGIKKFFSTILNYRKELKRMPTTGIKLYLQLPLFPLLYPGIVLTMKKTVEQFLDEITKNDDLKLILAANIGYYHDNPTTMAYSYFAIAQASYYSGGGHYVKGGSQKLSDYFAKFIKDNGGEVLLSHKVIKILTENNKAVGIEYKKMSGDGIDRAYGINIIANAAIPNVVNNLLPKELNAGMKTKINKMEIAHSILSIYLFFKKPVKELGNKYYSTFVANPNVYTLKDVNFHVDHKDRGFTFVDYSQIDSQLAAPGKGVGVITTLDYLDQWKELSETGYKNKKNEVAQIYIKRLNKLIPGIKDQIEYYEVGTPKTIERYTMNPQGAVYGFAQIPSQAGIKRMSQKSSIENLYFASAWTMPGGGFTGAMLSGWFCANKILKQ
ncbi:NAD(P)/FAD-dependent oxidoreductase [Patescibacteria group bacterium]|nr:NAD(P)/FAD-dependent oxidoreductase [Patescibacteria group bacterium]